MNGLFKYLVIQSLLLLALQVNAHKPDASSTLLVEQTENEWVLQIRAAMTAFEYEIESHFGASSYATPEEFQELVLKHIQENTFVQFNGEASHELKNGKVKLGHETSITFDLKGTPNAIKSLQVKNTSFENISRNQSALVVLKKGFDKDQFILNNKNGHVVELKVNDSKFEIVNSPMSEDKSEDNTISFLLLILGSLALMSILFFASMYFVVKKFNSIKLKKSKLNNE